MDSIYAGGHGNLAVDLCLSSRPPFFFLDLTSEPMDSTYAGGHGNLAVNLYLSSRPPKNVQDLWIFIPGTHPFVLCIYTPSSLQSKSTTTFLAIESSLSHMLDTSLQFHSAADDYGASAGRCKVWFETRDCSNAILSGHLDGGNAVRSDLALDDKPFPIFTSVLTYSSYESSSEEVTFSSAYLANLTIQQCVDSAAKIPPVLPDDTVRLIGWSRTVPDTNHFLLVEDSIPSLNDIRKFLGDQPAQFAQGYRGVVIEAQGN
jgi:hypothetical protein